jgi:hypothetical protein
MEVPSDLLPVHELHIAIQPFDVVSVLSFMLVSA